MQNPVLKGFRSAIKRVLLWLSRYRPINLRSHVILPVVIIFIYPSNVNIYKNPSEYSTEQKVSKHSVCGFLCRTKMMFSNQTSEMGIKYHYFYPLSSLMLFLYNTCGKNNIISII